MLIENFYGKVRPLKKSINIRAVVEKQTAIEIINQVFIESNLSKDFAVAEVENPARTLRYFFCEENYGGNGSKLKTTLKGALKPLGEYEEYRELSKSIHNECNRLEIKLIEYKLRILRDEIARNKDRYHILNRLIQYGEELFAVIHSNATNDNEDLHKLLKESFDFFKKIGQEAYLRHDSSVVRFFNTFQSFINLVNELYIGFVKKVHDFEAKEYFQKINNQFENHWINLKLILEAIENNVYFTFERGVYNSREKVIKGEIKEQIELLDKVNFSQKNSQGISLAEFLSNKSKENNYDLSKLKNGLTGHGHGKDLYNKLHKSLNPYVDKLAESNSLKL